MKVYSWNVLRSNRKLAEVYNFIENLDFDVLCLQEVTDEMLTKLEQMPFYVAYYVDRQAEVLSIFGKNSIEVNYAVILSRHEIKRHEGLEFPKLLRSFNSRVFEFCMELFQKWESITNLGSVYIDIEVDGRPVRIFSTHLALWNPRTRSNEFEHLVQRLPVRGATIICGDLNILEYGPLKILNWLLGSSLYEGMPWYPERELFEERFKKYHLINPLRGHITHLFSRSQLDHVLLSADFSVAKVWVEMNSHGSDHQPIGAEIELR